MARNIFIVDARIVDSNGAYHDLDGYPKKFDSASYNNSVDIAKKRADGDASETWGAMCKRDDRMIQTVSVSTIDGMVLSGYPKSMGGFPEEVAQE